MAAARDPTDRVDHPGCRRVSLAAEPAKRWRSQGPKPAHNVPQGGSKCTRTARRHSPYSDVQTIKSIACAVEQVLNRVKPTLGRLRASAYAGRHILNVSFDTPVWSLPPSGAACLSARPGRTVEHPWRRRQESVVLDTNSIRGFDELLEE